MTDASWSPGTSAIGEALRHTILEYADGRLALNVALMQLIMRSQTPDEVERALLAIPGANADQRAACESLLALWRQSASMWETVRSVIREADHDSGGSLHGPSHWAALFDRLAERSPEAGVALYSLGSPTLLDLATQSIVDQLRAWELLGSDRTVLDLGCGIGRITAALAGEVRAVVGLDVAERMLAVARQRCAGLRNVLILNTSGYDLAMLADGIFDLVLAVDTFPYLVLAGERIAEAHMREAHRVLKPRGSLVIFNYAYNLADAAAFEAVRRATDAVGFVPVRLGTRDVAWWDGITYHVRRVA